MNKLSMIPHFLKARSESELMKLCYQTNIKMGTMNKYFDFQRVGKFWVCWYYADLEVFGNGNSSR